MIHTWRVGPAVALVHTELVANGWAFAVMGGTQVVADSGWTVYPTREAANEAAKAAKANRE